MLLLLVHLERVCYRLRALPLPELVVLEGKLWHHHMNLGNNIGMDCCGVAREVSSLGPVPITGL